MRTKDILVRSDVDRETLRFYEKKGLLPRITRTDSGYRVYPGDTINRLAFIRTAKNAGFTLREIKELIDLKSRRVTCRTGRDMASTKLHELNEKMKALKEMKKTLSCFIQACESNGETGLGRPCHLSFDTILDK